MQCNTRRRLYLDHSITASILSSPLAQQSHHPRAEEDAHDHEDESLGLTRQVRVEEEVARQQLDQPRVDQDSGRDGVQHAGDHVRCEAAGVVGSAHTQTDSNGDGRGQAVAGAQGPRQPGVAAWEGDGGHARADSQALERLMEDEHGEQDRELATGRAQVQPDDDRVEDNAELEDEEGCDLLAEGRLGGQLLRVLRGGLDVALLRLPGLLRGDGGVEVLVLVARVQLVVAQRRVALARLVGDNALDVLLGVMQVVLVIDVALGTEVHQEDEHDRDQGDGWRPRVGRPTFRHADTGVGADLTIGRVEEAAGR